MPLDKLKAESLKLKTNVLILNFVAHRSPSGFKR